MLDDAFEVMQHGGGMMWVVLLVSVVTIALIAERSYVLWIKARLNLDQFVEQLVDLLEGQEHNRALDLCVAQERHPFAQIAKAGLMHSNGLDRDIQRAMEAAALRSGGLLNRRIGYLGMLANVATLLGLLGTVLGLIEAFHGLADADSATKQEILANGIAIAMFNTAFGLMVAVVASAAAAVLSSRQSRLVLNMDAKATELLAYLSEKNRIAAKRVG